MCVSVCTSVCVCVCLCVCVCVNADSSKPRPVGFYVSGPVRALALNLVDLLGALGLIPGCSAGGPGRSPPPVSPLAFEYQMAKGGAS